MTDTLDTSGAHNQIPTDFAEKVEALSRQYMGNVAVLGGGSNAIFRPDLTDPRIIVDTQHDDETTTTYQTFRLDPAGDVVSEVTTTRSAKEGVKVRLVSMSDEALIMSLFDSTIIADSLAARTKK